MAYAWSQDLPINREFYERLRDALGSEPPEGLILHLVTPGPDGNGLRYIDVWESRDDCERFLNERVHPVLGRIFAAAGRPVPAEPPKAEFEIIDLSGSALPPPR